MTRNSQKIRFLRRHIPEFECEPGCHDCCGPVTASSDEMARLPMVSEEKRSTAFDALNCTYLGETGCTTYTERPLICRLFGTTPRLACPNGKRPDEMIDARIEQLVHGYFTEARHVLL